MECPLPNPTAVVDAVRTLCDADVDLSRLELSYLQAGPEGLNRLLYTVPRRDGDASMIMARRVKPADGARIEQELNISHIHLFPADSSTRAAYYSRELRLLFQAFPADRRIPGLPVAVDGTRMLPVLESMLGRHAGRRQLRAVHVKVMRYKPERKCLLRYDLSWDDSQASDAPKTVWARLTRTSKFAETRTIMAALYGTDVGFELPKPLGVVDHLNLELFGHLDGAVLFSLVETDRFPALCWRTGEALARFHALPTVVPPKRGVDVQINRLAENADSFACMLAAQQCRIRDIAQEITIRLREAAPLPLRLIHGDFHGDNILVAGERLALVDLEDCAMGETAEDVGSQWTQLIWHQLRAGVKNTLPTAGMKAFLEGYLASGDATGERRFPIYAAMHCFLYAHQCLRHPQDPMRLDDARMMLGLCETVLSKDSLFRVDMTTVRT